MADPRDPYGDNKRPPDQDTGSLLRDLRSLREAAAPRPGVARPVAPASPPPRPGGSPGRLIGIVLLMIVFVVLAAGYNAGLFDNTKVVKIGSSPSPVASATPSPVVVATSAAPSPSSTPSVAQVTPRPPDAPPPVAPGLVPGQLGLHFAVAGFLLNRFDPVVKPGERFAQERHLELLAASGGPAVWAARDVSQGDDELAVASAAASVPCTATDPARRGQVADALAHLISEPTSVVERSLGHIAAGDPREAVNVLGAGSNTETSRAVALALALAHDGAAIEEVDRALAAAAKSSGWSLGLRAHIAVMQGKRDQTIQLLTQVLAAATTADELYLASGLALRLGDMALTRGLLEKVKSVARDDAYAPYWLGVLAEKAGRADDAMKIYNDLEKACQDPHLLVAERLRRAILNAKLGKFAAADLAWKGAEDFDPVARGVLLAHALSVQAAGDQAKGLDKVNTFQEALDRWQRLIVIVGPSDDVVKRFLACYDVLKDKDNAREGIQFLSLLHDYGFLDDSPPTKGQVAQTLGLLKDRIRPRAIWEQAPK